MKIVRLFEDNMLNYELEMIKKYDLDMSIEVKPSKTEEEIIKNAQDADIIITVYEPLTKKVLENLPNLKLVLFRSIGFNTIDLEYANSINLPVSHLSEYCVDEVANYVVAAILMNNRRINDFNDSIKVDKVWDYMLYPNMRRLSEQTVGLIGFGNIPRLVAKRLSIFGCEIVAYDPFVSDDIFEKYGVKKVELDTLFEKCDYISSHLPLNDKTKGMLNKKLFDKTTKEPVLINSSRGAVVVENDLVKALENGKFSYAILDVVSSEDPDLNSLPFMQMKNVVLTPHIAFYSTDAILHGVRENMENIKAFINGNYENANIVNKVNLK